MSVSVSWNAAFIEHGETQTRPTVELVSESLAVVGGLVVVKY